MPYIIKLDGIPAEYALNLVRKGEGANIIVREFTSSEDGDLFISRLEAFPLELISKLPAEGRSLPLRSIKHITSMLLHGSTCTYCRTRN
jgi:hypothetical protein